jgi:hypothetical protein
VPSQAEPREDTRVWIGRVAAGHEAEHARFIDWLNGPEAADIFRRRRLNEYLLMEEDGTVTVVFRAPHTGDPRLMIDFLRYPGLWPAFWEFVRGGRADDEPPPALPATATRVHWRRDSETEGAP